MHIPNHHNHYHLHHHHHLFFPFYFPLNNMKHALHFPAAHLLFLLLVFILSINTTKATRSLAHDPKQGRDEEVKKDEFTRLDHSGEIEEEGPWNLMGLEHCDDGDEECLKRRLISEAHLDYIYTQHQKQP